MELVTLDIDPSCFCLRPWMTFPPPLDGALHLWSVVVLRASALGVYIVRYASALGVYIVLRASALGVLITLRSWIASTCMLTFFFVASQNMTAPQRLCTRAHIWCIYPDS
ncbi:hypothetical protein BDZ89DRAFT_1060053 [Hymenopellis radicata]|nr:hypothetical protein BDZ89DRAFT_1060053 [Hymenopellis radicata]